MNPVLVFFVSLLLFLGLAHPALLGAPWEENETPVVECPEDSVLVWDGQTNAHTACITWDDLYPNTPYPAPTPEEADPLWVTA